MPQTPQRKAEYQRQRRVGKTAKPPTNKTSEGTSSGAFRPHRDGAGRMVLKPGGNDLGREHYWGWVSHAEEGTRICEAFEFGPGHWIGGCGMVVKWEGKPLSTNLGSEPDLSMAIVNSPQSKEIQSAMPVTKTRPR